MTVNKIGFVGLGKMGYHLVKRILESGQSVSVHDSKQERINRKIFNHHNLYAILTREGEETLS